MKLRIWQEMLFAAILPAVTLGLAVYLGPIGLFYGVLGTSIGYFAMHLYRVMNQAELKHKRLLVVGAGALGQQLVETIHKNPKCRYELVGLLDDQISAVDFKQSNGVEVLGRTSEIVEITDHYGVDKVIIALPSAARNKISKMIDYCESAGIEAEVLPETYFPPKSNSLFKKIGELRVLAAAAAPTNRWTYDLMKRAFDVLASSVLLLIISPLLLLSMVLVRLTSKGPIFFTQERVGRNGRNFHMLKFRTMLPNAQAILDRKLAEDAALREEWNTFFKLKKDPRITAVGSFLRKASIDELPQLINVLRGEMSLVGPRPLPGYHVNEISLRTRVLRSRALPGMTGLWQVSGRSEVNKTGMESLDQQYVQNWSLKLDFMTLLQTVPAVLRGAGAV